MEEMKSAVIKYGLEMGQTWLEIKGNLLGIEELFTPGLDAVGAFDQAFQNVIETGGKGEGALIRIRDAALEAKEAGFDTFAEWQAALEQKFDPEQVRIFFQGLADQGVTNFDQLINASDDLAISVVAHLDSIGFAFEEVKKKIDEATESTNKFNSAATGETDTSDSESETGFARGGIIAKRMQFRYGGKLGLAGEMGPEAIMPLTRIGGKLGVHAKIDGGGGSGIVLNMDLRGAQPGVGAEVRRAIDEMSFRLQKEIPSIVSDEIRRGSI
jgi:hypothetical protein